VLKSDPGLDKRLERLGPLMSPALDNGERQPDLNQRFATVIGQRK